MDSILIFFAQHGLWLTIIALVGIVVLGVLKYAGVFKKLSEESRHTYYMVISVGLSVVGSVIYTLCTGTFNWEEMFALAGAILALNQTFYSIYANLTLKELCKNLVGWIKELIQGLDFSDEDDTQE